MTSQNKPRVKRTSKQTKNKEMQVNKLIEIFPGLFSREVLDQLLDELESFDAVFDNLLEFVSKNE